MKRPGFLKRGERIRLQSFLARSGVASRRAAEEMITHGRIAVNGDTVTAMGLQVVPGVDRVEVDGEEVKVAPTTWLALHKPKGYVTTRTDPFGRETVYALLPEKYHGLFHVGRLDRDSEGLLLLTNDGDLANRFLHPSFGITKEYDVIVTGKPTDAALRQLVEGVELEDGVAKAESAKLVGPAGNGQSRLKLVLREGKKREVRRMMAALGHDVTRLIRRRFGPIDLAELPKGKWRVVAPEELSHVREQKRDDRADVEARPRSAAPAHDRHNAYGDQPGKRHSKPAAKAKPAGKDRPATKGRADASRARDEDVRPRAGSFGGKPARPGAKPARPGARSARPEDNEWMPRPTRAARPPIDADAPPRKRPAARTHAPELDDWADAPPARSAAGEGRPAPRGKAGGFDRAERPSAPRGKAGPRDRAKGGFDREERAAGPRSRSAGDDRPPRERDERRPAQSRGGFDREDRPAPRGKVGSRDRASGGSDREERRPGPSRGGFDREDRPTAPRGKTGPRDRASGGSDREERRPAPSRGGFDREDRPSAPRGKTGPRDRASGGFDREERRPGPSRGGDAGPARGSRFDREETGSRGVRPPSQRNRAPVTEDEVDELDSWSSVPRRSPGGRKPGGPAAKRPGGGKTGASGGKPGGRPSGGKGGGRPGGKPGGTRGPAKPRKPGGGKPRGR